MSLSTGLVRDPNFNIHDFMMPLNLTPDSAMKKKLVSEIPSALYRPTCLDFANLAAIAAVGGLIGSAFVGNFARHR